MRLCFLGLLYAHRRSVPASPTDSPEEPYIRERIWHPSQELEELPDGRVVLRLRAGGFYEIRSWVLSFGAAAEVLEPEELREAVREEMGTALELLRKGSEGG